jgi:NSS family neurotransmitter:Na+ symporter
MSDMEKANEKVGFKSKMGFILAAAGSAIGLGNLWKFPYMAGKNGGGTFVLVYLACVVLIGLGVLSIEFIIGRNGGVNAIDCYGKHKKGFKIVGYLGVVGIMLLLSFYAIIGGWTVAYIFKAITGNLIGLSPEQLGNSMGKLFSSPGQLVIYQILFLLATAFIVAKGIASGIEKYCNILMPILFVLLVVLGIRSLTLPGATDGFVWLFKPDFSKLNGKTVVAALGQVFLSLSIGSTGMVCYAAYMKKEEKILRTSLQVAIADTLVALLGGIVIIPAVFAFGLEPSAGPTWSS